MLLALIAGGVFLYLTRPVEAPSIDFTKTPVTSSGALTSSGGVMQFSLDANRSQVTFSIFEVLSGKDFTVVGTTNQIAGTLSLDTQHPSQSKIGELKVNARTFKTDSSRRDGAINRMVLKSENPGNEFITFVPTSVVGLPEQGVAGREYTFATHGMLTVAGVTKPASFTIKAQYTPSGELQGTATSLIKRGDFNLIIPSVPFVANVGEEITLKVDFVGIRS